MKNLLREYFTFTKKERIGVIVLLVLILFTSMAFYFIPTSPYKLAKPDAALLKRQLAAIDSSTAVEEKKRPYYVADREEEPADAPELFAFDPNTLSAEGWERLGVRPRTAQTIQRYIAKGGHFRQPGDLRKIYGLRADECDRLIPYVQIATTAKQEQDSDSYADVRIDSARPAFSRPSYPRPVAFDINEVDTSAFIALPGIGSKLAGRIIHFREKLGGFCRVEQVGETYGLPDSTFQLVRQWLQCKAGAISLLNINTAEAATLQQHPYIRWQAANAIVQYRQQHGRFQSVDQLLQINIITPEMLSRMAPYLTVNEQ